MRHGAIVAVALSLVLAPGAARAVVADPEGLLGRLPRQCDAGVNAGCLCSEGNATTDCPGAGCRPVPFQTGAKGILTIVADDGIRPYQADSEGDGPARDEVRKNRAFTLLLDIKVGGRQHLLSETYQNLADASLSPFGEERVVDEQAVADLFGSTPSPAEPNRALVYFVPREPFKLRLQRLLGNDAVHDDLQPVLIGLKKQEYGNGSGDLATALSLKVALAAFPPVRVCGSTPEVTTTPTPLRTATARPTASATSSTTASLTPVASRTATPVPTVTSLPTTTSSAVASATVAPARTATPTSTRVLTITPTTNATPAATASAATSPSPSGGTATAVAVVTATPTSNPGVTPTPAPANVPVVLMEDRIGPLKTRGNETSIRVTLSNPTVDDLGRVPYTATFTIAPADGQVTVTTAEIQGRPVVNAGYKDYLRVGIGTAADAPVGEHRVSGVFRFSPSSLPAGAPPSEITQSARVRIE